MKFDSFINYLCLAAISLRLSEKYRYLLVLIPTLLCAVSANAQLSGSVFRDFNGNGSRQTTTGTFVEPLVPGVIVTAYNNNDVIVASYTTTSASAPNYSIPTTGTAYNGIKGSGTGFVANNAAVRLEFTIPISAACLVSGVYDFTSKSGKVYGTSVRFVAASSSGRTGNNFALNNPNDYVAGTDPRAETYLFQAIQFSGNPLASSGTSRGKNALVKFPYSRKGTTALGSSEILASAAQVGSVYGVAYSKYAKRVFTSAFMKRHSGFGPADGSGSAASYAPGTIYIVNPALSSTSTPTVATSFFVSLDKMGYPTHNSTGTPTYANAFTLSSSGSGSSRTETVTFNTNGLGVVGTPANRDLGANTADPSNDPAAFGQVGKVSLGAIELSDDGKYLFVVNLYDRKIYQLQLNSVTNPTDAIYVASWSLPNPPARSASGLTGAATTYATTATINDFYNGVRGLQRPFALKYYHGKLYIGSVTTGEGTGAQSTTDNNTGNVEYTDLWSYVWELNPATSTFTTSPVLQFPLNYPRGTNTDSYDERWRPWSNTMPGANVSTGNGGQWSLTQPILAGIEFDIEGSMILGFRDRSGDQGGFTNYMLSGTTNRTAMGFGDQLRAFKNPTSCSYELEYNGKEGPSSTKSATLGADGGSQSQNYNQGPGGGEFYFQDGLERYDGTVTADNVRYHVNTAMGGLALLPGMEEVAAAYMDPLDIWSGGISWMNNNDGTNPRDYQLYAGTAVGDIGKANGLGDVELLFENPPIEIGNRVWKDLDGDGIQDAGEAGIAGVVLELVNSSGTVIGTVTTDTDGTWYFSSETGTDATGIKYGVALEPQGSYKVRLATSGTGNDWDPTASSGAGGPRAGGALVGLKLTRSNITGNGEADLSDNDASLVSSVPQISLTVGRYGENNHTFDIGFVESVNLGNKVWKDLNNNGIIDSQEPIFGNVTVNLYEDADDNGVADGPAIATTTTDPATGLYLFDNLLPGTYIVGVVTPTGYGSSKVDAGDPDTDTDDNDDNGVVTSGTETRSNPVILAPGDEPTGESPSNNPAGATADNSSNLTVDFGFVELVNLGNKVWKDLNNNGLIDSGEPIFGNVTVNLYEDADNNGTADGAAVATTTTDPTTGLYLFNNLYPGTYLVGVVTPAGYVSSTVNAGDPDTDADDNDDNGVVTSGNETRSNSVTLAAGGEPTGENPTNNPAGEIADNSSNLTVDFGFIQLMNLGNKVWIDADKDGIFDTGETLVDGATVKIYADTDGNGTADGPALSTTTTVNGIYLFADLVPGKYLVSVMDPGIYVSTHVNANNPDDDVDNDDNGVTTITTANVRETFSKTVTLINESEPENDGNPDNNPVGTANNNSNLTVDFGFVDPAALPVNLLNFNGKADEANHVRLAWNTTQESNSSHFEVQRSADGKIWAGIGTVLAKGESRISQSYDFVDRNPLNGDNLYRLKMIDRDATFGYSRVINVKMEGKFSLRLFPNPASYQLKIEASNGAQIQKAQFYSLIGKLVYEVTTPKAGEVDVRAMAAGVYTLRITTSYGSVELRKIAIVR